MLAKLCPPLNRSMHGGEDTHQPAGLMPPQRSVSLAPSIGDFMPRLGRKSEQVHRILFFVTPVHLYNSSSSFGATEPDPHQFSGYQLGFMRSDAQPTLKRGKCMDNRELLKFFERARIIAPNASSTRLHCLLYVFQMKEVYLQTMIRDLALTPSHATKIAQSWSHRDANRKPGPNYVSIEPDPMNLSTKLIKLTLKGQKAVEFMLGLSDAPQAANQG